MFQTSFTTQADVEKTFRLIASGQGMELFQGSFLVPGIEKATITKGGILVKDTWGFWHKEILVQAQKPSTLVFHIMPNRLLRFFLRSLSEEWSIEKTSTGSLVTRTFSLLPQKWAGPLLPFFEKNLEKAIQSNNETLSFYLLLKEKDYPKNPLV